MSQPCFVNRFDLSDVELTASGPIVRVEILREGTFNHPKKKFRVDENLINELHANFSSGLLGTELPVDEDHLDPRFSRAKGWIVKTEPGVRPDGKKALFAFVKPTASMIRPIKDGEVKYFSPSIAFGKEITEEGKPKTANVLRGGAWTNIPFIKAMSPAEVLNFSELDLSDGGAGAAEGNGSMTDDGDPSNNKGLPHISEAQDADAESDELPEQCRSCKLLYDGSCPFAGVEMKIAAAGDATCPRYEQLDVVRPRSVQQEVDADKEENEAIRMSEKKDGEAVVNLADYQALMSKVEALETSRATDAELVKTLNLALSEEVAKRTQVEASQKVEEVSVLLSEAVEDGRITPHQRKLLEPTLLKAKGFEGVVDLSDIGAGEVDLDKVDLSANIKEFIESLEPNVQIDMSERIVGKPKGRLGGGQVDADASMAEAKKRFSANPGIPLHTHYREVIAEAQK